MKRVFIALGALALPVDARVFAQPRFVGPDGQKKLGDYVWVWRSAKIASGSQRVIDADCPSGYAVLGGGYEVSLSVGVFIYYSKPNNDLDGWTFSVGNSSSNPPVTVTVYASCAPAKPGLFS
jgi:hypothetical protein